MKSLDNEALGRAAAGSPDWLASARATAFATYSGIGPPSSKDEEWRYVDLDFSISDFGLAEPPPTAGSATRDRELGLTVVDGFVQSFSAEVSVSSGLNILPLASALETNAGLEGVYDGLGEVVHDQFSAASRAFAADGAYVHVDKGAVVAEVVTLDVRAATSGAVSFPRVIVDAEEGSQCSVVVHFSSDDEVSALAVPEIDLSVGVNANVALTVIQDWGSSTSSIGRVRIVADRDAQVTLAEAGLGGAYSRLHLSVDLEGKGSSAQVVGAYFGDRRQVLDYRYFMRHVGERTYSDMFLKGGVEDEALSIFTGMIRIEETAQRTNAFQTNRNLILSEDAAAQSVPNLEILANDVKCGHGSTVGPLDEEQRYYLMSRGLDLEKADRLQVRGFFEEALARFPERSVTAPVRERINAKYTQAQEEGRV